MKDVQDELVVHSNSLGLFRSVGQYAVLLNLNSLKKIILIILEEDLWLKLH